MRILFFSKLLQPFYPLLRLSTDMPLANKKSLVFAFAIIFLSLSDGTAQRLLYDVVKNGSSMGTTVVERIKKGSEITHHLNTKTEFRVLFLIKVEYDLFETFRNNKLISGTSFNTLNESTQKETKLKENGKQYDLIIDGIHTVIHEDSIAESVSEIYFEEPFDGKKVFSAYFGRFLTFEKIADHQYELESPDGSNIYKYENGICVEVLISRDFATFSQVLKPEILADVRSKKIKL